MVLKFSYPKFIKAALFNGKKFTTIRAGRRTGKTYNTVQWSVEALLTSDETAALWVDTKHGNIDKYVERYFLPLLKPIAHLVTYNQQKKILLLPNGKYIDFGSAERAENIEGFGYAFGVLNEAGIILKKPNLWDNTLRPMFKDDAQVKIIGTPKGKNYFKTLASRQGEEWEHYQFTAYDSPFWNPKELESIRSGGISDWRWKQEYMAEFVEESDNSLLELDHLRFYEHRPPLTEFGKIYMHADTTHTGKSTSDYFALVVLAEHQETHNYYVLDFVLKKMDVEAQAKATIVMYQKFGKQVAKLTFDEKANQGFGYWAKKLAKDDYKLSLPLEELKYPSDKFQHFEPHVPHFKSGRVYLPSNHPQIEEAQNQLLAFPDADINDDFVDGMSGVLDNFKKKNKYYFSVA